MGPPKIQVMVESSDKTWSTGEGNGKPLQCACLENPMNSKKRQKDRKLKDELPRWVGAQYATGDQWRNNSRKNEESESEVAQSSPTLCNPMDCSPPGPSVHGVFQARVLEWVAISFSRGSSRPRDQTRVSHVIGRCFTI